MFQQFQKYEIQPIRRHLSLYCFYTIIINYCFYCPFKQLLFFFCPHNINLLFLEIIKKCLFKKIFYCLLDEFYFQWHLKLIDHRNLIESWLMIFFVRIYCIWKCYMVIFFFFVFIDWILFSDPRSQKLGRTTELEFVPCPNQKWRVYFIIKREYIFLQQVYRL